MDGSETAYDSKTMTDEPTVLASSPLSLVIPSRPEYVALCRLVVGALGVRDSLDEEVVADLKVIVTEACNCFLVVACGAKAGEEAVCGAGEGGEETGASPACSIRMDFDSRPHAFVISVLYPERRALVPWLEGCDPMSDAGLGLTILKALTDEMVEFDTEDEGTVLRLTKFLPA
jgi:Histidine kinase-like ATPase domain